VSETLDELRARLDARAAAAHVAPRRDGEWYVWDLPDGTEWRTRPFTTPAGRRLTPLAPALYYDEDGAGHWNVPELRRLFELDAPDDEEAVIETLREAARLHGMHFVEGEPR
jgi:hypothetical protein